MGIEPELIYEERGEFSLESASVKDEYKREKKIKDFTVILFIASSSLIFAAYFITLFWLLAKQFAFSNITTDEQNILTSMITAAVGVLFGLLVPYIEGSLKR